MDNATTTKRAAAAVITPEMAVRRLIEEGFSQGRDLSALQNARVADVRQHQVQGADLQVVAKVPDGVKVLARPNRRRGGLGQPFVAAGGLVLPDRILHEHHAVWLQRLGQGEHLGHGPRRVEVVQQCLDDGGGRLAGLNVRGDGYGATREGRVRLPLEVLRAVRGLPETERTEWEWE